MGSASSKWPGEIPYHIPVPLSPFLKREKGGIDSLRHELQNMLYNLTPKLQTKIVAGMGKHLTCEPNTVRYALINELKSYKT